VASELYATLTTSLGPVRIKLFPDHAPKTVKNFVGLSDGSGEWTDPEDRQEGHGSLYAGTVFHRVITGFMIQGGDPLGTGTGGPATASRTSSTPSCASTARTCSRWPTPAPAPTAASSSSPWARRRT
jgi:peptidyl-prolyl cis-trans isomerase A (cyclophilin A)